MGWDDPTLAYWSDNLLPGTLGVLVFVVTVAVAVRFMADRSKAAF